MCFRIMRSPWWTREHTWVKYLMVGSIWCLNVSWFSQRSVIWDPFVHSLLTQEDRIRYIPGTVCNVGRMSEYDLTDNSIRITKSSSVHWYSWSSPDTIPWKDLCDGNLVMYSWNRYHSAGLPFQESFMEKSGFCQEWEATGMLVEKLGSALTLSEILQKRMFVRFEKRIPGWYLLAMRYKERLMTLGQPGKTGDIFISLYHIRHITVLFYLPFYCSGVPGNRLNIFKIREGLI